MNAIIMENNFDEMPALKPISETGMDTNEGIEDADSMQVLHEVGHQQIHEEPTTNMEKLNEDSAKTQDLGTEELIQCLEIKTETNDSSEINAGSRALDLEPEELIQCLPCAGQSLSAFDDSLVLPYVRKDHDLIEHLAIIVIKDVSNHPKKPANEGMSTILKTSALAQLVMCEIKRFGFSFKNFSEALEVNAATFSLSLREPRHWFDANMAQKRCYYSLYLWLNLPESYRRDTFHTLQFHENFPTATLPVIHTLTNVLANELSQTESGLKLFASHVLKENTITVRNLILCPIPWPIMSNSLKLKYAQMWFWLKQSSSRRMVMLGLSNDYPNTFEIAKSVLTELKYGGNNINKLAVDVNPGLPKTVMKNLLHKPIDWNSAFPHEKYIYVCLMDWLGQDDPPYDAIDIDSTKICHEGLDFVRDNRVTIKEFADNVVKIPRAHVSLYFHNPKPWAKAKDSLRAAFINVAFWLNLNSEQRMNVLRGGSVAEFTNVLPRENSVGPSFPQHKAAIVNSPSANSSTVYSASKYIDPITEAERIVNEMKENEEKVIDTFKVSNMMKTELRKAGISLMNFAKVVKINRNYLSSLINKPLEYEKASKLQKQVYQSMYHWLNHKSKRTVPFTETARPALQTLNISTGDSMQDSAQLKKIQPRQPRVKFTNAQRDYLNKCFECNPKPSQEQKVEMSKMLGLDLRTIVIYFCNKRARLSQMQKLNQTC